MSATGLYTTEELYRLLPAVYRIRDAEQGGVLRELLDVLAGQVNVLAESLEQLYDDQFIETCAPWVAPLHRRPGRLPDAARRRPGGRLAAGRGREHDPLPAAQGHRLRARAARRRRHRLAGARGRVLRAARDDAVHEPRPAARGRDDRPAQRGPARAVGNVPGRRLRHVRAHRRDAPHPESRPGATTSRTSASSSGACDALRLVRVAAGRRGRHRARASASTRSEPTSRSSTRRARRRRSRTSRSRSTCRCRCCRRFTKAHLRRALRRRALAAAGGGDGDGRRRRCRSPTSASATSRTTRPRPARGCTRPSPATRTSPSTRCSGGSRSRLRPPPARRGSRPSTTARRSRSAAAATTAPSRSSLMHTVVPVEGGDPLGPPLDVGRGRRRGADPRQPDVRRAGDDHRDHAGSERRRPRPRAPLGQSHASRCSSRTDQLELAMDPDTTVVLNGLVLAGGPLVIEESADAETRRLVLRHCTLVPGRHARSRRRARTRSAARA